ncbi:VWA domain-containing protein [Caldithrix abyssi]|uniref:Ca-activated chloride channel family protein n=1 Tax=Caldithrix abyssi DSM 13497 TaxID=880073 RepID=H1XZ14_CALAY|nr:VWA domain-containing protein [Caldithrix abyssi]APF18038.1 Ca-activated chloride channel family protein [Caldithrix abyssi DSM 13497]EHO42085.1 von Willebrand factor type A [Caldithrix abyssi DSM 13497]
MEVLKFRYPIFLHGLWGVLLLIIFFVLIYRHKQALLERFGHIEILKRIMPGFDRRRMIWKNVFFILSYAFFVIALADPQIGTRLEEVKREGVDIIVALDVSNSMLAEDIKPSRLEKAKHELDNFIDLLQGDRIGLIAFAGMAHLVCPLTLDYGAAKLFLQMMDTDLIPVQGTALEDAIRTAIRSFNQKERKHKVLILITDGEDHEGDPVKAAEEAAKEGIIIYTIGIGSPQGVPIPVYDQYGRSLGFKKDRNGNVVTTKLDVKTLQKIAFISNGKYYIASSGQAELRKIYDEIRKMEKKELSSRKFAQYEDRYQIFVILGLIFLMLEFFLPVRTKVRSEYALANY